ACSPSIRWASWAARRSVRRLSALPPANLARAPPPSHRRSGLPSPPSHWRSSRRSGAMRPPTHSATLQKAKRASLSASAFQLLDLRLGLVGDAAALAAAAG